MTTPELPAHKAALGRFASLRKDIDRMLSYFGLSQDDVNRTHTGDPDEGGTDGTQDGWPGRQERELHDGDAEQRSEASVPRLRKEGSDEPGGRRVLPLDSVPVVRLAQRAEGDVSPWTDEDRADYERYRLGWYEDVYGDRVYGWHRG